MIIWGYLDLVSREAVIRALTRKSDHLGCICRSEREVPPQESSRKSGFLGVLLGSGTAGP